VKESYFERAEGDRVVAYTTLITGKGQVYFEKKLREEASINQCERRSVCVV